MESEPIYVPYYATSEERQEVFEKWEESCWRVMQAELCACGSVIGSFKLGGRIGPMERDGVLVPRMWHSTERCALSESDLQATCKGPYRKGTGAYVGCTNCEPYVRLTETRDSPYVYGVQFNDFNYQVFDGDSPLQNVLEVKVGVGGYIIQARKTPDFHMCPCYLLEPDDPEIEPKVCRVYIPGNGYRVEEID